MLKSFSIRTSRRNQLVDITYEVKEIVKSSGVDEGLCIVYVPHTTAGITVNENADPSVKEDISNTLEKLIPHRGNYAHLEGNADSHIKSSIVGPSLTLIIHKGNILLGTWQGVFLCEFDGPRNRTIYVKIIKG